jgi:lysophospholipase
MELFASDGNPVPEGAVIGTVATADGVTLRCARWPIARKSRGTVCLFQGRGHSIERDFETIGDLRRRRFDVAIVDWRGQGGSERLLRDPSKGHVDSFADYDHDLEAFMQQIVLPDCPPPHHALAHSMGGLICLRAARAGRARFDRMVLSAPMIAFGPTRPSQPTAGRVAAMMTALGLGEMSAHGDARKTLDRTPFSDNLLTGDPRRYERTLTLVRQLPQVWVGGPTYGWVYAACRAMAEAEDPDFAPAIKVPTLVLVGALDRVVSIAAIETLAGELKSGACGVIVGGKHELLLERDPIREQFWAAFDAFVDGA